MIVDSSIREQTIYHLVNPPLYFVLDRQSRSVVR
jgi:hypothetical protein